MDVLYELHQKRPDLIRDHHVFIDGGVRRGTDVIKALCLGARGGGARASVPFCEQRLGRGRLQTRYTKCVQLIACLQADLY